MKMSMGLVGLAAVAVIGTTGAATAQTSTGQGTTYNFFSGTTNSGTFGNNGAIGNRTFSNIFTFIVTRTGDLAADFSNSATRDNRNTDIDFSSAVLTGGSLTTAKSFTRLTGEPITLTEVWGLTSPLRISAGTYKLTVAGRSWGTSSTFSGNFNVAAVPEPASWAMMIAGVGMAGGALRRRRAAPRLAVA